MIELPKIFGGKPMRDDNVTPLRDAEPTRPQRFQPPPAPPQPSAYHHDPKLPRSVYNEMLIAREIFTELLSVDPEARQRIVQQVEHLLKMYGKDDTTPPEGAPV